jgi:exopolysaccharide biosynthesis polyprenyl glycosylphosphotransferase
MLYQNVHIFAHYLRLIDAAIAGISTAAVWALGVRFGLWPEATGYHMFVFASAMVVAFVTIANRMRIYHARRTERLGRELAALVEVLTLSTGIACLFTDVIGEGLDGRAYGLTALAAGVILISVRVAVRLVIRRLRRLGKDNRSWIVVGRNERAARIAREVLGRPHYGIQVIQFVDLREPHEGDAPERMSAFLTGRLAGIAQQVLDTPEQLRDILAARVVDEVVIALPVRSRYDDIGKVVRLCVEAGISAKFPADAIDRVDEKLEVVTVGGIPLMTHYNGPASYGPLLVKRIIDFLGAAAALIVALPLFVVIPIAIKATSPGPVFFGQDRSGFHGRKFRMLKFRTMVKDAPKLREELEELNETDGAAFKIKNDPRITPVGRVLRKYHLDELPQLWNVLVGDMSLVGPRPLPPKEAQGNEWWQKRRLTMPPGLTCFWQAEGDHQIPFRKWMEMDLEYIDRWSLMLDFRIMLSTVGTLIRGTGW